MPRGTGWRSTDASDRSEDLANEPLIMYAPVEARYFYDLVVRLIPVDDQNVVHSVSQVLTMLWLVAAGRGIAFVPASATGLGIDGVALPGDRGPADRLRSSCHLLWLRDAGNPALRMLLDAMQVAER